MRISKRKIISISIIFLFVSIVGCIDKTNENDVTDKEEIIILKSDTILVQDTRYGEVNVSYQHFKVIELGKQTDFYYNITVKFQEPTDNISYIGIGYGEPNRYGQSWLGRTSMTLSEDNVYFIKIQGYYDSLDIWIWLLDKGEKVWNETYQMYTDQCILTEIISATISIDFNASEVKKQLSITNIKHGFDFNNINYYNISYNVSGTTEPEKVILHFNKVYNETVSVPIKDVIYGESEEGYCAILVIQDKEKKSMESLYFSIALSNDEEMRVTSPVYKVDFT